LLDRCIDGVRKENVRFQTNVSLGANRQRLRKGQTSDRNADDRHQRYDEGKLLR
jgi:hypothetical protein